jgi:anti-sigma B factor antagonist
MTMTPAPGPADVVTIQLDDRRLADGPAGVRWLLLGTLHAGARSLVVDLSQAHRLPDSAVAVLLWGHRICLSRGGSVVLRGADGRTEELLRRTGLSRVLLTEPTQAAA